MVGRSRTEGAVRADAPRGSPVGGSRLLARRPDGHEEFEPSRCDQVTGPRVFPVTVVVIVEAPERLPARHAKDRLRGSSIVHPLDVDHPSPNALLGRDAEAAVVSLDEAHVTVGPLGADAPEVHELVPSDGFATALVLPVTHRYDDVHHRNLCRRAGRNAGSGQRVAGDSGDDQARRRRRRRTTSTTRRTAAPMPATGAA